MIWSIFRSRDTQKSCPRRIFNFISSYENALEYCTHTFLSPESIPGTFETSSGTNDLLFFKNASKFVENREFQTIKSLNIIQQSPDLPCFSIYRAFFISPMHGKSGDCCSQLYYINRQIVSYFVHNLNILFFLTLVVQDGTREIQRTGGL